MLTKTTTTTTNGRNITSNTEFFRHYYFSGKRSTNFTALARVCKFNTLGRKVDSVECSDCYAVCRVGVIESSAGFRDNSLDNSDRLSLPVLRSNTSKSKFGGKVLKLSWMPRANSYNHRSPGGRLGCRFRNGRNMTRQPKILALNLTAENEL